MKKCTKALRENEKKWQNTKNVACRLAPTPIALKNEVVPAKVLGKREYI
jgi:hypothetical protein